NPEQQAIYQSLSDQLTTLLASNTTCPGDGNGDLQVDQTDLDEWAHWADPNQGGGASSWYDFNHDGITDEADKAIIEANLETQCQPSRRVKIHLDTRPPRNLEPPGNVEPTGRDRTR